MLSPDTEPSYQVELPEFEGPLDLLLHLVKRHELNLVDIPIAFVTEKYLAYLDLMRSFNVDIASEYLLMAATLAYLKSRELLPPQADGESDEPDDEGINPKEQLIQRLLEYQRYKEAAEQLSHRPTLGRTVFERGALGEKADKKETPLAEVGVFELLTALSGVMQRSRVKMSYDVVVDRISITDRINEIVDLLDRKRTLSLDDCFTPSGSAEQHRHQLIITFLAVLEMVRLRILRVLQETRAGTIYLTRCAATDQLGGTTASADVPEAQRVDGETAEPVMQGAAEVESAEDLGIDVCDGEERDAGSDEVVRRDDD